MKHRTLTLTRDTKVKLNANHVWNAQEMREIAKYMKEVDLSYITCS